MVSEMCRGPGFGRLVVRVLFVAGICLGPTLSALAQSNAKFPFRNPPIDYFGETADSPVADLAAKLDAGTTQLEFLPQHGYLPAVLQALKIPVESQVLVYSKTSVHARLITPRTPRAIYFNDDVYVGWVPGIPELEIATVDLRKGAMFYSLKQSNQRQARLQREQSCLLCHVSSHTLRVPGHLVRSFLTDKKGMPLTGYPQISHNSPTERRWGGWYVTGTATGLFHLGNLTTAEAQSQHHTDPAVGGNVVDLRPYFDVSQYLSPQSDIVALLVLDHQLHLHNLVTRVNYEHQLGREDNSEEDLLRYLLFVDEAPLAGPIRGTSAYRQWFEKQGPRDSQGRSLRTLDLDTRLLKYRCSYLIGSPAFLALPAPVKDRLYRRLWEVLSGSDTSPDFQNFPADERQAIVEILRDTQPDLPEYWAADSEP